MSTCPELPTPVAPLTLRLEGLKLGQRALFTCPVGYTIEGVSNATCLASGNLSRSDTVRILWFFVSCSLSSVVSRPYHNLLASVLSHNNNKMVKPAKANAINAIIFATFALFIQEIGHRRRPHAIQSNVLRYFWKIRIWASPNWIRQHMVGPYSSARGAIAWMVRRALSASQAAHGTDQCHDVEVCSQPNSLAHTLSTDTCCRHDQSRQINRK